MADPSRRECLQQWLSAGCVSALALDKLAAAEVEGTVREKDVSSSDSPLRLGFGTYGMRALSALEAVRACAEIGYDGVEFCLIDGWPTSLASLASADRKELKSSLNAHGLLVPSLLESLPCLRGSAAHRQNLERLRKAAEFANELDQDIPPVVQSIVGGRSGEWEKSRDQLVAELSEWAEVGKKNGVTICFKPHASHLVSRPEQALWVLEQVDRSSLRIVYDFSHYSLEGLSLEKTLSQLLPVTPYIQVKDSRGTPGKHQYLLPGDGETDYSFMFQKLMADGYQGFVNVEVSSMIHRVEGYDPHATAKRCYNFLKPILNDCVKNHSPRPQ